MSRFAKSVNEAGAGINALLIVGFLGIVWLMVYGNLSGNLGFGRTSSAYYNETITLLDGAGTAPASTSSKVNGVISGLTVTNASDGAIVPTNNYTVSGIYVIAVGTVYNNTSVNVSYTVTYDSTGKVDSDGVISNLTQGTKTFYGFSNTLFTIMAIVLLITILLALLYLVLKIAMPNNKGGTFAGKTG